MANRSACLSEKTTRGKRSLPEAGTIYALGCPLMSPFIGGGLVTTAYPYIIQSLGSMTAGLIFCGASIAILIVLRLLFWNKNAKREQR